MKRVFSNFQAGFTMLEIMVALTLLSVVSGIGFFSFIEYSRLQEVDQASKNLASFIEKARSNSVSHIKPSVCDDGTLFGYKVEYCPSQSAECQEGDTYEMRVVCGGQESVVETLNLSEGIIHLPSSNCSSISFSVPNGVASGALPCSQVIEKEGKQEIITVGELGHVVFGEDGQDFMSVPTGIPIAEPTPTPTTPFSPTSTPTTVPTFTPTPTLTPTSQQQQHNTCGNFCNPLSDYSCSGSTDGCDECVASWFGVGTCQ